MSGKGGNIFDKAHFFTEQFGANKWRFLLVQIFVNLFMSSL